MNTIVHYEDYSLFTLILARHQPKPIIHSILFLFVVQMSRMTCV